MAYKMKGYSYAGKSPLKQVHAKKSTESAHGQLGDAKVEYQNDLRASKKYWYKINGKVTTKAAYNAYENKPGGDEIGKQTNDPDASGNKAKIAKDRASRDWKPAYEGGDYSKEDLRKMTPKQRKKIEKGQE